MPHSRICRVDVGPPSFHRRVPDVRLISSRHSHSDFRKDSRLSCGWNRVGGTPAGSL
jgi:hypothetical protein